MLRPLRPTAATVVWIKSSQEKALKWVTDAKTCTSKAIAPVIGQVFMLYSNLLMEEAR